ncbi:MAG TPA: type VI secretion system baseplate subunit TssG [Steroidobacteraceae bacterium]|nr:type VI secretion system baseplate subunit TssG [Steroidobacteraceae bacterium]
MRRARDPLTYYATIAEKPWNHDFYHALRCVECLNPALPLIGKAVRPGQEPIRLGQEPALDFAPSVLSALRPATEASPPRIEVRFLGLLGPNGPMPLHFTDYVRERLLHGGDATMSRFLDVFNHRFLSLFYRAWAQAQPTVTLDRPQEDRFAAYVGALLGVGSPRLRNRDAVPDFGKLFHAGLLVRHVRNRDGLEAVLGNYFHVPVRVKEFAGHWMALPVRDRTRLGTSGAGSILGAGAVLGARVWDRQHNVKLHIGPLDLTRYESFLPGGTAIARLVAWVRTYLSFELAWDASLSLKHDEVPKARLGQYGRLGWTTWLGRYARGVPADDLKLDAERSITAGSEARESSDSAMLSAAA